MKRERRGSRRWEGGEREVGRSREGGMERIKGASAAELPLEPLTPWWVGHQPDTLCASRGKGYRLQQQEQQQHHHEELHCWSKAGVLTSMLWQAASVGGSSPRQLCAALNSLSGAGMPLRVEARKRAAGREVMLCLDRSSTCWCTMKGGWVGGGGGRWEGVQKEMRSDSLTNAGWSLSVEGGTEQQAPQQELS